MTTPMDQLIPPDECDVEIYTQLRNEFLDGTFTPGTGLHDMVADLFADGTVDPSRYREALSEATGITDETPTVTKSSHRLACVGTTSGAVCGNATFTLVDGEPLCKRHRGDTR